MENNNKKRNSQSSINQIQDQNMIKRYPFNGRSKYLIDRFYIIGFRPNQIHKIIFQNSQNMQILQNDAKKVKEEFSELLKHIDKELSEFYSVFTSVRWNPSDGKFLQHEEGYYYTNIGFSKEFGNINTGFVISIRLTIQQFMYKTAVSFGKWGVPSSPFYNKELSYTESLTDQDKEDIVNVIGNLLNQFIETQGFTTHGPRF